MEFLLYHGTTDAHVYDVLDEVDETIGNLLKDFGRGFYTTTRSDKALDWANLQAARSGREPAVVEFSLSREDFIALDCLFFIRGDKHAYDYWHFVQWCRSTGAHNRLHAEWYDLVAGPISGDWKKQTTIPNSDQFSFHTARGVDVLNASKKQRIS
jgi:hypothetical protein